MHDVSMVRTAFHYHDRAALWAIALKAGHAIRVGNPGVAIEADAMTPVIDARWFVPVHDDLLSIGGPDGLPFRRLLVRPKVPEPVNLLA